MRRLTLIYDLETSGFNPMPMFSVHHKIVQVCARAVETGALFNSFVNPCGGIPPQSTAIHKISDADVEGADTVVTVMDRLFAFFRTSEYDIIEMIAHNNDHFDEPMLLKEYRHVPGNVRFWDSLVFMRAFYAGKIPGGYGLSSLYTHFYKAQFPNAHRADADVLALTAIYKDYILPVRATWPGVSHVGIREECLVDIHYIGAYRASLIIAKLGLQTTSDLRAYFALIVMARPLELDRFVRDELGVDSVTQRVFIISHILQIPLHDWDALKGFVENHSGDDDCMDNVDYYVKYKYRMRCAAPQKYRYQRGLFEIRNK